MNIEKILFYGAVIFISVIIVMLFLDIAIDVYWNHTYKLCDTSQIMGNNVSKVVETSTMIYYYCKRKS